MNVMVSIPNTYVWIAPENRSKYTCRNDGMPSLTNHGSNVYQRLIMIVPASTFPNRRRDMDTGVANSLITLTGKKIGNGSNRSLTKRMPLLLIHAYSIITKVMIASAKVVPKSAVGARSPKTPDMLDRKINAINVIT